MKNLISLLWITFLSSSVVVSCSSKDSEKEPPGENNGAGLNFSPDNGSLDLPDGFKAVVVADNLGNVRHIDVDDKGVVYARLGRLSSGKGTVALQDTNEDGVADIRQLFTSSSGTGIKVYNGFLYYSTDQEVFRRKFDGEEIVPSGEEERIATLPSQSSHGAKSLAFDGEGYMYVNVGAPSNSCQEQDRVRESPGQDPCPLLENHAGIWRFSDNQPGQQQSDGIRYATGIRNAVGITWNSGNNTLYAMQHGRDQLNDHWPGLYTREENAELPAEEMLEVQEGDDFGWPYCYYDHIQNRKLLNPEYGGDKETAGRCAEKEDPVAAFPGHWAPNAITFYNDESFPSKYRTGAFIAFHGSWNRAPLPQQGYKVVFVPFSGGKVNGKWEDFATGFAGDGEAVESPGQAEYRPCGLAVGPDGSLYISDSVKGRIWRIVFTG